MKLLEHFRAMQAKVSEYLEPATYTSEYAEGIIQANSSPADAERRALLFITDMIYMLDGPEQREAQAEALADGDRLLATIEPAFRVGWNVGFFEGSLEGMPRHTPKSIADAFAEYKPELVETKTVRTETRKRVELGSTEIARLLATQGVCLPARTSITIQVPGGGDWSNTELDVDDRNPVVVSWTEVDES